MEPILVIEGLRHRLWDDGRKQEFIVTVDQTLAFNPGSFTAILGPNGCGKTTLLTVLGLLRQPGNIQELKRFVFRSNEENSGNAEFDLRQKWSNTKTIETLRRKYFGFALQSGELLDALTVKENIAFPLWLNGFSNSECQSRVDELLKCFDLLKGTTESHIPDSRINSLSGGEYQRVALARAVAHRPTIVFVDEPTASLNRVTARNALGQLQKMQKESGDRAAVVMITHDEDLSAEFANVVVRMKATGATSGTVESIEHL